MDFSKLDNFDTIEVQTVYDICVTQQQLQEVKDGIKQKMLTGTMTDKDVKYFKEKMKITTMLVMAVTAVPFVKLYKNYDYFKFNRALHDMSYN